MWQQLVCEFNVLTAFCRSVSVFLWGSETRKNTKVTYNIPTQLQHQYTPVIPTCAICITHTLWLVLTCTHSLRSHCSMRRWQYWKAFSLNRSFGGSRRLEEEVAETIETTDPSTSERSSAAQKSKLVKWVISWKLHICALINSFHMHSCEVRRCKTVQQTEQLKPHRSMIIQK